MADEKKSGKGMYPDAYDTAPGGMSRKALIAELVDKHGYEDDQPAWAKVTWPTLIDLVIEERQAREKTDMFGTPHQPEPVVDIDADLDIEDMFDDFAGFDDLDNTNDEVLREMIDADFDAAVERPLDAAVLSGDGPDPDDFADLLAEYEDAADEREANAFARLFQPLPGVKDYIFDGHLGAGPSASERWMNCTMSLTASREFLETLSPSQEIAFARSGDAARQGTTAHAAAEVEANLILGRVTEEEVEATLLELSVLPDTEGEAYSDEMAEYITEYTDLIRTYAQERGDEHILIESRVEAGVPLAGMKEGETYYIRGSADLISLPVSPQGRHIQKTLSTLVVADLKYGDGIAVSVDENPQVRIYGLGSLALLADPETGMLPEWLDTITYHIVQPRLGGIKTWTESIDDLLEWRDEVLSPALTKALYGSAEGATYEPSAETCQWCPARGGCAALAEQRMDEASAAFDVIVDAEFNDGPGAFPETGLLTDDRLGELLSQIGGLINIHDALKAEAQRRLFRGDEVPGFQLVSYTPPRGWGADAEEVLGEVNGMRQPPALLSPTQALKKFKEDKDTVALIESAINAPAKRPVIAREGDRRKPWVGREASEMFAVEEGE